VPIYLSLASKSLGREFLPERFAVNRKRILSIVRILVSVGLIVFVCSKIRVSDTLIDADGNEYTGRLTEDGRGPDTFRIRTDAPEAISFRKDELKHDAGRLIGVHRGIVTVFSDIDWSWFIPTFLWVGLVPTVGAFRFRLLLAVQGVKLKVRRVLGLTFLGYFFNNFMLGLTGGDVVKAYYVTRDTHKRTEAVVTVFLDRVVGLIALAFLAGGMVVANLGDEKFRKAAIYVWIFVVMSCFMVLMLYSRRLRRKVHHTMATVASVGGGLILGSRVWSKGWSAVSHEVTVFLVIMSVVWVFALVRPLRHLLGLQKLRQRMAESKVIREMDEAFHVFSRKPGAALASFGMSFFCHFVTVSAVFGFARSLGITHLPFHYFLVFVPVIFMIAAVPVSLAGWGVQEAVFQMFFGAVGVGATEAITLSFIYRLCAAVLWSLPGGVVLMLRKDRATAEEVERAMRAEESSE